MAIAGQTAGACTLDQGRFRVVNQTAIPVCESVQTPPGRADTLGM